ncbi:hypothetical protein SPRG_05698 [Saprolegnia parasitica CBS 223.65]|uniref:Mitochondrial carnitine/acylcarnitine carrier protein n=1 Tax=Saprolegnia parasitica (strain CBS 223.65) TaxID=695850 RepID=A0A067CDD0_SAPPC|nr:hypothetical protein SPRG_05698 [Saprolegnia parasitica CBS 223.65]KDO28744.1 hypothetical protein SPRG_05698 [Saprolegnia parasitica CBS 223.65]|eukprot:XP_012200377.1 hypothetical protein SPRG_05698 [Saprolegnia parasitica CBS 223.65]
MANDTKAEAQGSTPLKSFLSGGFGGMCLVAAGHPLDLIKVNMQTMPAPKAGEAPMYASAVDCARKIVAKDGPRGLYRGLVAPLATITPIFATYFWGYDLGALIARKAAGMADDEKLSMSQIIFAGGFSAIPTTVVMSPGERIKCLLQIQAQAVARGEPPQYKGMVDCASQIYRTGGLSSLMRGWEATLLRDIPGSVGYFGGYEGFKRLLTPTGTSTDDLSALRIFFAGCMGGVINWIIAIPPDVIKSRIQTAPDGFYTGSGIVDAYKHLVTTEGHAALFKGMGPAMARAFPANAACFLGMEFSKKLLTAMGLNF